MSADDGGQRPAQQRQSQNNQNSQDQCLVETSALYQRHALLSGSREVRRQNHVSFIVMHKSKQVLAVHRAVDQRRNLLPFFDLAIEVLEWLDFDRPILIRRNLDVFFHRANLQEVTCRAAARDITPGNSFGVCFTRGQLLNLGGRLREGAIQKVIPQRATRADLAFAGAVVRNEETNPVFQHEMQVAMEVDRIAAMSDDASPVTRLFIEAYTHAIERRAKPELAGMHPCGGFGAPKSC